MASNLRISSPKSDLTPCHHTTCHTPPLPAGNLRICDLSTGSLSIRHFAGQTCQHHKRDGMMPLMGQWDGEP